MKAKDEESMTYAKKDGKQYEVAGDQGNDKRGMTKHDAPSDERIIDEIRSLGASPEFLRSATKALARQRNMR